MWLAKLGRRRDRLGCRRGTSRMSKHARCPKVDEDAGRCESCENHYQGCYPNLPHALFTPHRPSPRFRNQRFAFAPRSNEIGVLMLQPNYEGCGIGVPEPMPKALLGTRNNLKDEYLGVRAAGWSRNVQPMQQRDEERRSDGDETQTRYLTFFCDLSQRIFCRPSPTLRCENLKIA
jgi:hypothetical protein